MKVRLVTVVGNKFHAWKGKEEVEITEELYKLGLDEVRRQMGQEFDSIGSWTVWNTEDGRTHPGDMWWASWMHNGGCPFWDDCKDPRGHLAVICPDGSYWDIDSRASNCTLLQNRNHRCWIRHGEPPNITVDKQGKTCGAGGGSIQTGGWHGFLRNGDLVA